MSITEIKKFIEENKIDTVELGFADINGVLRGKRLPARHFLKIAESGTGLAKAPFAWDVQCGVYDDIEIANFDNGFPDMFAKPILSTLKKIPWREGSAFIFADLVDEQGQPIEENPREVLKKVLKRYNDLGFRPLVGSELEFYLLDADKKPVFKGVQCYSLYRGAELEYVIQEMRNSLEGLGIELEAFHIEYGPGQIEVIAEHGDALEIADKTVLIKNSIKEIARKHGLYATFMAKPWAQESGSGSHIHQSLWDLELKNNYFATDKAITENYLAGLLKHARDFMVLGSPTINDYKRFQPNSFVPTSVTWAHDNRTVATRSLLGIGKGSRFEQRNGSAAANPYLIIAASLASGLNGIENKLIPPKKLEKDAVLFPKTLDIALNYFEASEVAKEHFGERFVKLFLTLGRHEVELYNSAVTDWEWDRYFEII
ncbi:MAG TPA: glutamine synthetase family protein [Desulfosporosinus sp.]|nr:glutamine synthetase family protein [Desulfosporosinus sp.]